VAEAFLPFVDEEQLCYLVGAISGCSGCQHGTQNLCNWIGYDFTGLGVEFHQCVPRESAEELVVEGRATNQSHNCPLNPHDEPVLNEYRLTFENGVPSVKPLPVLSEVWTTYHDMVFGRVNSTTPTSWAVDRTSLWADLGIIVTGGYRAALFDQFGDYIRPRITCATLNDPTALDTILPGNGNCDAGSHPLLHELVDGILATENDAFCLDAIFGAYLSTRCPEYGVAVSGISFSLYKRLVINCEPSMSRQVFLGPTVVSLGLGIDVPFNILGLPIVPDGTPFALEDITVPISEQFENYLGIDEVNLYKPLQGVDFGTYITDVYANAANFFLECYD
jgi:hypothetical protein